MVTLVPETQIVITGSRRIRWAAFDRLCNERGWTRDAERARQLGFSDRQLSHMRCGRSNAGPKVIAAIVAKLGAEHFDEIFEAV
jgi:hypothetical protein